MVEAIHCGSTVSKAFSPFFIVFTAFEIAGQKYPAHIRKDGSY